MEITLEANPGTVDESRFVGFRQAALIAYQSVYKAYKRKN